MDEYRVLFPDGVDNYTELKGIDEVEIITEDWELVEYTACFFFVPKKPKNVSEYAKRSLLSQNYKTNRNIK